MAVTVTYDTDTLKPEFQVNTYTAGNQLRPDMLGLSNGGFVAAYNNSNVDNGLIRLNFYDAGLNVIGSHKIPYEPGIDAVGQPSLTQLTNGNVLVVWDDDNATAPGPGLKGAIYTATGDAVAGEFALTPANADYSSADVTALENGNFVVTYTRADSCWFRMYDSTGDQIGGFTELPGTSELVPQVAALDGGGFVTAWKPDTSGEYNYQIWNSDGSPFTAVETLDGGTVESVVGLPGGGFAIASILYSVVIPFEVLSVIVRIFDAFGEYQASTTVSTTALPNQVDNADVTVLSNGFIATTWTVYDLDDPDNATSHIYCAILDSAGAPVTVGGEESFLLAGGVSDGEYSSVSALLEGLFVAGWEDTATDGSGGSLHGVVTALTRTVVGNNAADFYSGDDLRDDMTGNGGNDTLLGAGADDILRGGSGADGLGGGDGDDLIFGGVGGDDIFGGDGADTIFSNAQFGSSTSGDTVDGGIGDDEIFGAQGDDLLQGNLNADVIRGGDGDDRLFAMTQANPDGSNVGDGLFGGDGDDSLQGSDGGDTLSGGVGDDDLSGGDGGDAFDGGSGEDEVSYEDSDEAVAVNLATGAAGGGDAAGDTFAAVEDLSGSAFDDVLGGSNHVNVLKGNGGNDVIVGDLGGDFSYGGSGDDTMFANTFIDPDGSAVGDFMFGGAGKDTLTGSSGGDTIEGGLNADTLDGRAGDDLLFANSAAVPNGSTSGDALYGGTGDDGLTGSSGDDVLRGGGGDDSMSGGGGSDTADYSDAAAAIDMDLALLSQQDTHGAGLDTLNGIENVTGGAGNDDIKGTGLANILKGLAGKDTLVGRNGDDVLTGGLGADDLRGGAGADRFVYLSVTDSQTGQGAGKDDVLDFDAQDIVDLTGIDAIAGTPDDDPFDFVANMTGQAGQATLRYLAATDKTTMRGDVDGDGLADFVLTINGQLTAADFAA